MFAVVVSYCVGDPAVAVENPIIVAVRIRKTQKLDTSDLLGGCNQGHRYDRFQNAVRILPRSI